jgi:hypothetical protein
MELSQDRRCPNRDPNPAPAGYEARALLLRQPDRCPVLHYAARVTWPIMLPNKRQLITL